MWTFQSKSKRKSSPIQKRARKKPQETNKVGVGRGCLGTMSGFSF